MRHALLILGPQCGHGSVLRPKLPSHMLGQGAALANAGVCWRCWPFKFAGNALAKQMLFRSALAVAVRRF